MLTAAMVVALIATASSAAGTFRIAYAFTGNFDGGNPATSLTFDADGTAYGTTVAGGKYGCGTVFKLVPAAHGHWSQTVLHAFGCFGDGKNPHGGVTLHAGKLYGTTVAGGPGGQCTGDGCGEVYELTPQSFRVLYGFTGGNDGFGPGAAVVFDSDGNLFGETPDGGKYNAGTVFEMSQKGNRWQKSTIYNFTGNADGGIGSLGPLLLDRSGNLFGVTEIGGANNAGTAFELVRHRGDSFGFRLLYAFHGRPDAGSPYGGLIADSRGSLYGTTYFGGASGQGTIYELQPAPRGPWVEHVLYSFRGGKDGALPTSTLLADASGNFFATTSAGGQPGCACGTVVKYDTASNKLSVAHVFTSSADGAYPYYGLSADPHGKYYYGTAVAGGVHGAGTVFGIASAL